MAKLGRPQSLKPISNLPAAAKALDSPAIQIWLLFGQGPRCMVDGALRMWNTYVPLFSWLAALQLFSVLKILFRAFQILVSQFFKDIVATRMSKTLLHFHNCHFLLAVSTPR